MFSDWKILNKTIDPPIDSGNLEVNLSFEKNTISEFQPVLSFDKLLFSNSAVPLIMNSRKELGPYYQIPINFRFSNRELFNGYLTDFKFLLDRDQIEAKPVSIDSTDGLSEKLSAITASLLKNDYKYRSLDFTVEKVDFGAEFLQISLSILFYSYALYTQLKEIQRLIARGIEATGNAGGLAFGTAAAYILELAAQVIFLAITVIQLIAFAKQMKELVAPKKRNTKVITFYELIRAPLARIGYDFVTEFDDMYTEAHWASGDVNKTDYQPRSTDRCGNALGALNFVMDKYAAKVIVRDKTLYLVYRNSKRFAGETQFVLGDFIQGNYEENTDDMIGTREILYATDYEDQWTLENYKGTEYKVTANISDPTKSTIKGYEVTEYGIALCNRKDKLNNLEKLYNDFAKLVNSVISFFGGKSQTLKIPDKIGIAKVDSDKFSVAKIVRLSGSKLPQNHRELLSAKVDEHSYHWVKSHVRNPEAKTRIYENEPQIYGENSLSLNIRSSSLLTREGKSGNLTTVKWKPNVDYAELSFEISDVNRETKLIEEFEEAEK